MQMEKSNLEKTVGALNKRREMMPDGRRYIIYYTFSGAREVTEGTNEMPEKAAKPEMSEERNV